MRKRNFFFILAGILVVGLLLSQIPAINSRLAWRYEVAKTYIRNVINPVSSVPTAIPNPTSAQVLPTPTIALTPTSAMLETPIRPTATLAPPPVQAALPSPPYEKQTPNNCGPAAL